MKIRREEIDGVVKMITPCHDCIFYDRDCKFGRRTEYQKQGKVRGSEIIGFCNYVRPPEWAEKHGLNLEQAMSRVIKDNKIKFDCVFRISSPDQITLVKPILKHDPYQIVFSYTEDLDKKELIEQTSKLGHKSRLVRILDEANRLDLELAHCVQTFHQILDANHEFFANRISQLDDLINNKCLPIVAILGDSWHESIFISALYVSMRALGLEFCHENIIKIAKDYGPLSTIRKINGKSLCNYS